MTTVLILIVGNSALGQELQPNVEDLAKYAGQECHNDGDPTFCMVCNIYFESAREPYIGKVHVGRAVLERVGMQRWGKSACPVIWAYKQFSWTWVTHNVRLPYANHRYLGESYQATLDAFKEGPNGADHYFNFNLVNPGWARNCWKSRVYEKHTQEELGQHLFLKCAGKRPAGASLLSDTSAEFLSPASPIWTSGSFMRFQENGEPALDQHGNPIYDIPADYLRQ